MLNLRNIFLFVILSLNLCVNADIKLTQWEIKNSSIETQTPQFISSLQYNTDNSWLKATVPTTVLNAFVKQNKYPDPRIALNNYSIPDVSAQNSPWKDPYWYRTTFTLPSNYKGKHIWLTLNGINYRADIWVNGNKIADKENVVGMFRRFKFDITNFANIGSTNCIAIKIYQVDHPGVPSPGTQLVPFGLNRGTSSDIFKDETLKFSGGWDCAPVIRDRNMGIYQDVVISATGNVSIKDSFVESQLTTEDGSNANLYISSTLCNHSDRAIKGNLKIKINLINDVDFITYTKHYDGTMKPIEFSIPVSLAPQEKKEITLSPAQFKQLSIDNPYLWWPNGYGEQYLHQLKLTFSEGNKTSDVANITFGIREVKAGITKNNDEAGLTFYVNKKRIFCKGGWIQPDALLDNSTKNIYDQARLIANANINLIGSEDMPSPSEDWLDSWDKYGIMDWHVFYQCYRMFPGRNTEHNPLDNELALKCAADEMKRYRNHPSIIAWVGVNEVLPDEQLYRPTKALVKSLDSSRPFIPTTSVSWDVDKLTPYLKEDLPIGTTDDGAPDYNWMPDDYYFDKVEEVYLQMFKNEMGMPSVPTYESLKKFIPGIDAVNDKRNPIFPLDSIWAEHGAWDANNFCYRAYDNAIRTYYSDPKDAADYARKGNIVSACGYRAMLEAANHRMWDITTGIMLWKINSCWPDVCWQLYDWYLSPNASYYFSKKAMEPLHIQLNANDHKIVVVNSSLNKYSGLSVKAEMVGIDMQTKWSQTFSVDIDSNQYKELGVIPSGAKIPTMYFVKLSVVDTKGNIVSDNLYWQYTQHPNYYWLVNLPKVELNPKVSIKTIGKEYEIAITLTNDSQKLSFFNHLSIRKGDNGDVVNPVFWDDNFITLFPGDTKTITAKVAIADLDGYAPTLKIN